MELEQGTYHHLLHNLFKKSHKRFWGKFAFYSLFQKVSGGVNGFTEVGNIGARHQYLWCFKDMVCNGNLVFHVPHPTRFHLNASSLRFVNEGDLPAGWRRLTETDRPPRLRDVHHLFMEVESSSSSEEEEEEKLEWGVNQSAYLLFLIDHKKRKRKWIPLKSTYFSQYNITSGDGLRMKYERLKSQEEDFYINGRDSRKGREFRKVLRQLNILIAEEESSSDEEEKKVVKRPRKVRRRRK